MKSTKIKWGQDGHQNVAPPALIFSIRNSQGCTRGTEGRVLQTVKINKRLERTKK